MWPSWLLSWQHNPIWTRKSLFECCAYETRCIISGKGVYRRIAGIMLSSLWCLSEYKTYVLKICTYGSVSAGRKFWLFNVTFFKLEPPCDQTRWNNPVFFSIVGCLSYVTLPPDRTQLQKLPTANFSSGTFKTLINRLLRLKNKIFWRDPGEKMPFFVNFAHIWAYLQIWGHNFAMDSPNDLIFWFRS